VKQQKLLVVLVVTLDNLYHLLRCGLTSFEYRFLKEFEESLRVLVKNAFFSFELFLQSKRSTRMEVIAHLHVSMPHVEKLAHFLVLLPPIFPLTVPGTIQGGLACGAVLELDIWRCEGFAADATPEHDCWW
jgi:hypothetical protein